ncbi:SCN4A [Symbiodinium natans]|uniref:SCN4A protein n=1 Tax=Symbiodinium natans TaxID=878477 RepID=A0A812LJ82_9DINO|nr:SCN4A [Symbiodinium natans]
MFPCPLDVAGAWSIWRALGVNSFEFAGDAVSLLQIKANIQANPSRANTKGSSLASERARLKSLAESLARERDELDRWKTSAFVEISDHKSAVANAAAAALALESGSVAKMRWKLATARIVNLLGKRDKMSLVDKMKKNMKSSMLATSVKTGVPWLRRVVTSYSFELFFVFLIVLNCISMMVQIEMFGLFLATTLDIQTSATTAYSDVFYNIELGFGLVFSVEILIKFFAFGLWDFWKYAWNLLDLFIASIPVLSWAVDAAGLAVEINPMVLLPQLRRAASSLSPYLRMQHVRVLKVIQRFDSLHLLLGSIRASFDILAWSALVLLIMMTVCALALSQFLQGWIEASEGADKVIRQEVWALFGTVGRSIVSMFELTLANYSGITRSLMENVSAWFAAGSPEKMSVAILVYKLVVGFAVLKVITGIFIQQTMRVANEDDELLLLQKKRLVDSHAKGVSMLFRELDSDGSGALDLTEFKRALKDSRFKIWMAALDLQSSDAENLFKLLDDGDGQISYQEFLAGAKRLKGTAQSIDLVTLMRSSGQMQVDIQEMRSSVDKIAEKLSLMRK